MDLPSAGKVRMCELFKRESKLQAVLAMVAEGAVPDCRQPLQSVVPEALVAEAEV